MTFCHAHRVHPTPIGLVWIKGNMIGVSAFEGLLRSNIVEVELITKMYSM